MDVQTATGTVSCKVANCPNDAVARKGVYAGLCSVHIAARRRAESDGTQRRTRGAGSVMDGLQEKVKRLQKVGRDVDRLRQTARDLTERALVAKQRADEAEREFRTLARDLMGEESASDGLRVIG